MSRNLKKLLKTPAPWDKPQKNKKPSHVLESFSVSGEMWEVLERLAHAFAVTPQAVMYECLERTLTGDGGKLLHFLGRKFGLHPSLDSVRRMHVRPITELSPKKQVKLRNQRRRPPQV